MATIVGLVLGLLPSPTVALALLLVLAALIYYYLTREYGVFEAKGVHSIKPVVLFGNQKELMLGKKSLIDFHRDFYNATKGHRYCIHYEGSEAQLYVRDPELVKQIAVKDLDHFMDLGFIPVPTISLPGNDLGVGTARGEEWRVLKHAITPAFSLRNLKNITAQVSQNAERVIKRIMPSADSAQEVCMDDVIGCYTMDCISKTVFSIDIDAHSNPDSDFMRNGKEIISPWRFAVSALFPQIAALTGVSVFNFNALSFFGKLAREMIRQRDAMANPPNDVLGLMMKVRDSKTSDLADASSDSKRAAGNLMTNHVIERTLMQFFMDGFDSVAAVASATVYFVAANPEIQERAFEEVDEMSSKRGANLTGEDINDLKYLDCIISEATRLATTAITLRICTKEWTIPDTQVKIPVDMRVVLPIAGMHYDPDLFENPETFDPDRFSTENKSKIRYGTFMPFGLGGRQCVGMGIAKLEVKVLLFQLLRNFRLQLAPRTKVPHVWAKDHFIKIEGGVWVKLQKR